MANRDTRHPFALFGLEPRFDVDLRQLRTAWLRRAVGSHPDAAGETEESAALNDAYQLLLDPVRRAVCLLEVMQAPRVDERRLPPGFLERMIERRERADDTGHDPAARAQMIEEAKSLRSEAIGRIAAAFAGVPSLPMAADAAQAVHVELNVIRAFDRMLEQLAREAQA